MRQEELRAQNKQRVLDEALKCFYYEGIERTKVATIAQKAGVTSMSVYRYYGDKENIVLESAMLFWNKLTSELLSAVEAEDMSGLNGLERVEKLLKLYVSMYRQNTQALLLLQEFEIYVHKRKYFENRERVGAQFERVCQPIADALEAGMADGSVRSDVDRAELCSVIANALFGTMQKLVANTQGLFASKSCPAPRQMELLCDMFINYVKA